MLGQSKEIYEIWLTINTRMNSRLPAKTNPLGSTEEGTETRGLEMIRYSPPYGLNIPPSTMMGDHLLYLPERPRWPG
ncbi:hypothetical protein J6590_053750 [Homalodisca vitripennis]|nr:hypothetical protein J6590_053750 [Homalodisca vitripennis]